jgi:hypothetical protein
MNQKYSQQTTEVDASASADCSTVLETCDFCEEYKPIWFANWVKGFCSVECVNGYLRHEGFSHRLCINCAKQHVYGEQLVCCSCLKVDQ